MRSQPCVGVITELRVCRAAADLIMESEKLTRSVPSSTGEGPHQPRKHNFPRCSFGSKGDSRSFKAAWFDYGSL